MGFEVSLIPKESEINQVLPLIYDVQYQGLDNFCSQNINHNLENLDTNLKYDPLGSQKGKVSSFK